MEAENFLESTSAIRDTGTFSYEKRPDEVCLDLASVEFNSGLAIKQFLRNEYSLSQ